MGKKEKNIIGRLLLLRLIHDLTHLDPEQCRLFFNIHFIYIHLLTKE